MTDSTRNGLGPVRDSSQKVGNSASELVYETGFEHPLCEQVCGLPLMYNGAVSPSSLASDVCREPPLGTSNAVTSSLI
jgi:hypothetical protein